MVKSFEEYVEKIDVEINTRIMSMPLLIYLIGTVIFRIVPLLVLLILSIILPSNFHEILISFAVPILAFWCLLEMLAHTPRMKWESLLNYFFTLLGFVKGSKRISYSIGFSRLMIYSDIVAKLLFYLIFFALLYHWSDVMSDTDKNQVIPSYAAFTWSLTNILNVMSLGGIRLLAPEALSNINHFTWSITILKLCLVSDEISMLYFLLARQSTAQSFRGINFESAYEIYTNSFDPQLENKESTGS